VVLRNVCPDIVVSVDVIGTHDDQLAWPHASQPL
jgi:stage III sporulation protein SpoIIIAA